MRTIAAYDAVAVDETRSEHVTRWKGWCPEKERGPEHDITWVRERRKFAFKALNVTERPNCKDHIDNDDDDDDAKRIGIHSRRFS